nr:PREDICTED: integrator complex subunit 10 [Bemisia tabaci]XP_018908602.1 PREDICTED: integrator complex subunit 10 [Bemisia tabaci]XP_018908603.1 PREDICTED: integrator complex subunit 10 [Bemisia tabaci]
MVMQPESSRALSEEEYVVQCAKNCLEVDPHASKAWMITAKTLFPQNFGVQFEAYRIEKSAGNVKEAAKCFTTIYINFPKEARLWNEVAQITSVLSNESQESAFLSQMFKNIPYDIQLKILQNAADRSEDPMEHCRLSLLLLNKFPETAQESVPKLVETLISAEKHIYSNPVNIYRKFLVCDLMPFLSIESIEMSTKLLITLLNKSIKFYVAYLIQKTKIIQDLPESENNVQNSWDSMNKIFKVIGTKLHWEISNIFNPPVNLDRALFQLKQFMVSVADWMMCAEEMTYAVTILFLQTLHGYVSALEAGSYKKSELVLVETFINEGVDIKANVMTPAKKMRQNSEDEILPVVTVVENNTDAIEHFQRAHKCWSLLHRNPLLKQEFKKLNEGLALEPLLGSIIQDLALYEGEYDEYLKHIIGTEASLKRSLELASVYHGKKMYMLSVESLYEVVAAAASLPSSSQSSHPPINASVTTRRHLQYIPLVKLPLIQYCCKLLIATLKQGVFKTLFSNYDLALGHLLVLCQLDWPQEEALVTRVLKEIAQRKAFAYPVFTKYLVNPTILEEFIFLSTEQGGNISLDILVPSANQLLNQRRMSTRGVDKNVREDFKLMMRRQIARCNDPLDSLITDFLLSERASIVEICYRIQVQMSS